MKLRYYLTVRLLLAIPTFLILMTGVFFLMHILPGDPVTIMFGDRYPTEYIDEIKEQWGLDRPLWEQYVEFLSDLARLDLGISMVYKVPVIRKVRDVFPTTIEVAIGGLLLACIIGIPLGVVAALRRDSAFDHVTRFITLYLHSSPGFWLALLFQLFIAFYLDLLPVSGRSPPGFRLHEITGMYVLDSILTLNFKALRQSISYLFLPWLTIAITSVPYLSRLSRATMLNVLGDDYITTARAKGLPNRVITYKHALRNALLPIITSVGGSFTGLLGGTVITERIFALPGLGGLLMEALTSRDFTMIQGVVAIYAVIVVLMNTVIDIVYAMADPRVKY
jgi:ABC-type dipeptide/oligopeptide/nickel transport system permease component